LLPKFNEGKELFQEDRFFVKAALGGQIPGQIAPGKEVVWGETKPAGLKCAGFIPGKSSTS